MTSFPTAELISLGNELLIGKTVNTNATYLGGELTHRGVRVQRITTLPDDMEYTAQAIKEVSLRSPSLVIITGGLGPTWDDIQIEIVAKALELELAFHPTALQWIEETYRKLGYEMTESRRKMAKLPTIAKPLPNPVGTAPGYMFELRGTLWFGLPGVPSEMKAIFSSSVLPYVDELTKDLQFAQVSFDLYGVAESSVSPVLNSIVREFPDVYIKSHPLGQEGEPHLQFHLTSFAENGSTLVKQAAEALQSAIRQSFPQAKIVDA